MLFTMGEDGERVPQYLAYMNPILEVLRGADASGLSIDELDRRVFAAMKLPQQLLDQPHGTSGRSEPAYRSAWARSYLKKVGLITNPKRATWAVTAAGRSAGTINPAITAEVVRELNAAVERGDDDASPTARLFRELTELKAQMALEGAIPAEADVARCLSGFRDKFGPERLASLDGEALLLAIHGRGAKRDSLVYWLEFKDDDELPNQFGGIGGGSALKFDMFLSADTGQWMTGSPTQQRQLTLAEAITLARSQRDQLVGGARVLDGHVRNPDVVGRYAALQAEMAQAAPELADKSWAHKYFTLLFIELLETFHGVYTQRHHMLKLLEPPGYGRYENAHLFASVARQLHMSLLELALVLHRRNGAPHDYWRVGTMIGDADEWPRMRDGGFAAVGWASVGDITNVEKPALRELIAERHGEYAAQVVTKSANQLHNFAKVAAERDIVVAMDGTRVRGVGRIAGPYFYRSGDGPAPHRRPVEWLAVDEWKLPESEGLLTTFVALGKSSQNLVEIERRILGAVRPATPPRAAAAATPTSPLAAPPPLIDVTARIDAILKRKRQVILYGPPGTGKTYWAERAAQEIAARSWHGRAWDQLDAAQRNALVRTGGAIEMCAFHPAYGYEDFLEGYRPIVHSGALAFERRDGVFKRLCDRARADRDRSYCLIVDEINRGDIPRIFGELLTILEHDKRGKPVTLPLSGASFSVPDNVLVIGTMNTSDRSIALLDAALRRRFGFIELLPDSNALANAAVGGLPLGPWLDELNRRVVQHTGRDARNLQVGHSYLMPAGSPVREVGRFAEILRDDIIPLLEEYCYEDFDALARILGEHIVPKDKRRVDVALFEPERHDKLMQVIAAAFSEIMATRQAAQADAGGDDTEDANDDEVADP